MENTHRAPLRLSVILTTLTLVLSLFFVWLIDWRFHIFLGRPTIDEAKDLGFRFNLGKFRCEDRKSEPGYSPDFLGPCGKILETRFDRTKIENTSLVATSFYKVSFNDFFIDWIIAPSSAWDEVQFVAGELRDADLRGAFFRNVTFENIEMDGARLNNARFENCTFRNVKMRDIVFQSAQFRGSKLENIHCDRCDFRNAVFEATTVSGEFVKTYYNEGSILPFPFEDLGPLGFEYRQ